MTSEGAEGKVCVLCRREAGKTGEEEQNGLGNSEMKACLLYTSDAADD